MTQYQADFVVILLSIPCDQWNVFCLLLTSTCLTDYEVDLCRYSLNHYMNLIQNVLCNINGLPHEHFHEADFAVIISRIPCDQ